MPGALRACRLILSGWLCIRSAAPNAHITGNWDDGDAAVSSQSPHIPEPMVFDLVRPLGVREGDAETNMLALHSLSTGEIAWAPEIEFAVRDGLALELELPLENSDLVEYKAAVQGTPGILLNGRFIHGWQAIGRYDRHRDSYAVDALYLAGYRWSPRFSAFGMAGMRRSGLDRDGEFAGIVNATAFFNLAHWITFGIELDNEIGSRWGYLLMPQFHLDFSDHVTLQFGFGPARLESNRTEWLGAWRMIYAF